MKPAKGDKRNSIAAPVLEDVTMGPAAPESLLGEECFERKIIDGAELSATVATGVVFDTCVIRRVALDSSKLVHLRLVDVRVEKSNLANSDWTRARLARVEVSGSRLTGLILSEADTRDVVVKSCKADFLRCLGAKLKGIKFEDCILSDADFQDADLDGVSFPGCDLSRADFTGAKLREVDLSGAKIDGLRIEPAQLRGVTIDASQAMFIIALLGIKVR
ncbi:MAG: pentapeptide repeat-containing protein [Candidatus Binataceae bacterium]